MVTTIPPPPPSPPPPSHDVNFFGCVTLIVLGVLGAALLEAAINTPF